MAGDIKHSSSTWVPNCVLICNLHPNLPNITAVLTEYFENKELSGGGPIRAGGITKLQSEREAMVEFVNRLDADRVKTRKNHQVNVNGEVFSLEAIKCPMPLYMKYSKNHPAASPRDPTSHAKDDPFVVDNTPPDSPMSVDEVQDSNTVNLTTDNQPPKSPMSESPRDASFIVIGPEPETYMSEEVLKLQREKEERLQSILYYNEKIEEAKQKEKMRRSFIQGRGQNSFSEKALFESSEKDKTIHCRPSSADGNGTEDVHMDSFDREVDPRVSSSADNSTNLELKYRQEPMSQSFAARMASQIPSQTPPNGQKRVVSKPPMESQPPVKRVNNFDLDNEDLYSPGYHSNVDDMEEYEKTSRTVLVEGITEALDVDVVELFFESNKSGGGPLETLDMQLKSGRAILVFESKEDADNVLSRKKFTIEGTNVTVSPYTELNASSVDTEGAGHDRDGDEDVVIKVSGIKPDISEEMLRLFFEHARKSGGGEIKDFEVDFSKGEALLTYVDHKVAERVLSKKMLNFHKTEMTVTKLEKPKWDKKTVLVTGFGKMTEETLELLYENHKKSGGGPVQRISMLQGNTMASITFMKEADADQVLHQAYVKRKDGSVISACKPTDLSTDVGATAAPPSSREPTPSVLSSSIMVLGIDENITEDMLEMLFENEAKSGGGPVEKITIDPEFMMAVVTFLKPKVAHRVLARGNLEFQKLNLILQPHVPDGSAQPPEGAEGEPRSYNEVMEDTLKPDTETAASGSLKYGRFNCIEVSGLSPNTTVEFVQLFFESAKRSDGGEIESCTMNAENGTAVITFKEESTTKKVLQRHQESALAIEGCRLQLKAIDTSLYGGIIPSNTSCAIQITGLPVNASDESVMMFFENRRMSGGDNLEDIVHYAVEGRAVLTFATTEVAQRVIEKHQAKPIHFEGNLLQIQMLYSNSRPAQIVGPKEANVLYLKNVNEEADAEDIRLYLERVPKCKLHECVFGIKQGTALVFFVFMPGFEKFYELSCQKPLRGSMVDIECVARSKSIEVYGAEGLSGQKLQMYFEHQRSKGGEVDNVDILSEEKCAIVTFVKYGVAESVLSKSDHTVERKQLVLKLHHECIGILPPHHDHTSPGAGVPSHCTVDTCDPTILTYILSTPTNRKTIEDAVAQVYGRIDWPDAIGPGAQITIACTLQRSMSGLSDKVKTWSTDVKRFFVDTLSDFIKDELNVLQGAWQEFLKVTGDLIPNNSNDVQVTVDQDSCIVSAVGKKYTVEQMMDNLRQAAANVEEKLQRQAQIITETVNNLKAYQIKFLLAHKFPQNAKQTFKDMKIEADLKQKKVVLTGVPSDIITAKLQMYELVNQMRYEKLTLSKQICHLLKQRKTREYLVSQFQTREAIIVWDVSDKPDGEVMIYAKTTEELTSGVALVKSCIVEHRLDVAKENQPCFRQPSWSQMKETMLKDNEGELKVNVADDASFINVAANKQIIDGVLEAIITYMNENTILEKFANIERGTAILLQREKNQDIRKIEDDFKDFSVELQLSNNYAKPGYIIRGTKDGLGRALTRITALAQTIVACDHKINKPGMPQYFMDDRGRGLITSLETRYRVVILIGEEDNPPVESEIPQHKAAKSSLKPVIKATATLEAGKKVMVVQGDITAYCVDVIVNAANEEMQHVGGVARAIVDKGGIAIQQQCDKHISVEGRLLTGQVFTSTAGKLPCRNIIHTVGPKWQGGRQNEENELYESVYACLEEASQSLGFKTIALPAISSGVFGFPKDKCCQIILTAIKDYFKEDTGTTLREVHLVDNKQSLVASLKTAAIKVLGKEHVTSAGDDDDSGIYPAGHFQAVQEATSQATGGSGGSPYWTKTGRGVLQSQQGLTVTIVKGSIITMQVDVIVNTTNKELNLGSGGVSSMILNAAGATIQTECQQNAPGGVAAGAVVQTSGGNLSCKKIYHGACEKYTGSTSMQQLRKFLTKCLTTAHASAMTSIAIPAIGTGNLGFPRADVAQAMYEEVKVFSENHVGTSLQQINFVLYDKDLPTIQTFEAELDRLEKTVGGSQRHSVHRQLVKERPYSPVREPAGASYNSGKQRMSGYGKHNRRPQGNPTMLHDGQISQLHMEHLKVIVVKGDITTQMTDAIVNSTSDDLNFNSQVSRAILKAAGPSLASECADIGRVDSNHLAVTGAGNLHCRFIIHVAAPWDKDAFRYQNKWKKRISSILKEAVQHECTSISFPALGTGMLSIDATKMASTIFNAFHDFGKKATCMKEIRVVVFEDKMIRTFQDELENMTQKGKGFVEVLSDTFHHVVSGLLGNSAEQGSEASGGHASGGTSVDYDEGAGFHYNTRTTPLDESVLDFHIYGFSKGSIDQVTQQIDKTCKDETQDKVLDSKDDQEVIKKLSDQQIKKIMNFEKTNHVKITINKKQRLARLRIQGQHAQVLHVLDNVYRIFRETEQQDRDKSEAELLSKQVQWQFMEGTKYMPYPQDMNAVIEKAYLDKKPHAEFSEVDPSGGTRSVRVTFSSMKETQKGAGGGVGPGVDVRRYSGESVELPNSWSAMNKDDHFTLVDIAAGTADYSTVEQSFQNSFVKGGGTYNKTVLKIQRVQNPSMYKKYMVHKVHLDAANPPNTKNERILWHGTTDDTLTEIHTNGFNRSFCGKNGTAYGRGVYFATYATLSDGYAKPNAAGHRFMYQCKVLAGEFTRGDGSLLVPPPKNPSKPSIKFDSVVDNTTNPKIIVVFQDNQAYPEYLITYQ